MDKLKEYLLRHKADLDVDSPAGDAWGYIESKMSDGPDQIRLDIPSGIPARSGSLRRVVRFAAAACLIALAGTGLWLAIKDNRRPAETAKHTSETIIKDSGKEKTGINVPKEEKAPANDLARNPAKPQPARHKARVQKPREFSDEIAAIDKSYSRVIHYELEKLRATPLYAENGSYFSFYVEQFKQMDRDEQQVRKDIRTYGLTNEFLEQLINVYQQKLNLLKSLQAEINKMNNKIRGNQSPSVKTEVHYLNI
jgi:hypothetical protein